MNTNEVDELLEEAVSLHRQIAKAHDIIIVEGLVPTARDTFASDLNVSLAQALDAKVIFVSNADINRPAHTAEKVESQVRNFGGSSAARNVGVLFMRTRGLPEDSAQIPVTIDPNLRLISDTVKFTAELQKTCPQLGSEQLPVIGLVPFSDTPASHVSLIWQPNYKPLGSMKVKQNNAVFHSSLIASNIEHELHKFIAGELIISAS